MQDIHLPPLNTHPLPPPSRKKNVSGFARISWVVLLEAGGVRTPGPPARRRPCSGLVSTRAHTRGYATGSQTHLFLRVT